MIPSGLDHKWQPRWPGKAPRPGVTQAKAGEGSPLQTRPHAPGQAQHRALEWDSVRALC